MKLLILILISILSPAHASLPELFGSSAGTVAIGNQAGKESAANNYYAPAIQGFSKTSQFDFTTFYIDTNFPKIEDVVIKNGINTVSDFQIGDVEVNPTPTTMFGAHLSTPLLNSDGPKLNLSVFAPYDRLMEADSGDPYQPRYAMYENRFIRPVLMFSGAQSFGNWSVALGGQTGFQSNGETYFLTRTGNNNPSVGKVSFNAKPSLGFITSLAKKWENGMSYLAYQQEMKSRLINRATGETEIGGTGSFPFDLKVSSFLFYDPMTIRAGHQIFWDRTNLFLSVEFQQWDQYESTTLRIKKQGGVINGSDNFEELQMRNIFIPKVGFNGRIGERWGYSLGYFYRPTPLRVRALKNAGNTIDTNKHVGSLGTSYDIKVMDKILTLDLAYQSHLLENRKVEKTAGREDGLTSEGKIGSPDYRIGGIIHVVALGLSWKL